AVTAAVRARSWCRGSSRCGRRWRRAPVSRRWSWHPGCSAAHRPPGGAPAWARPRGPRVGGGPGLAAGFSAGWPEGRARAGRAAIVRGRVMTLGELTAGPRSVFVALHEVGNPGNLGTIIRTANAAGAGGVILIGQATDPFDPVAVKASMGALFSLPVAQARE